MNKEYTTEECLQEYYNSLEKQLKEKDAMINWFANILSGVCKKDYSDAGCGIICPNIEKFCNNITAKDWIKSAQEAVNKNNG